MLDIGFQELILVLVIALLVFGPRKLPELGRAIGRAMREFRRASDEFRSTLETNLQVNEPDPGPPQPPPEAVPSAPVPTQDPPLPDLARNDGASAGNGEPYWSQRGSRLFHARECGWARRIPETERAYFKGVGEAREQNLQACPVCAPWEPE
jgi:TatA/E family protein of Tat protein translocase